MSFKTLPMMPFSIMSWSQAWRNSTGYNQGYSICLCFWPPSFSLHSPSSSRTSHPSLLPPPRWIESQTYWVGQHAATSSAECEQTAEWVQEFSLEAWSMDAEIVILLQYGLGWAVLHPNIWKGFSRNLYWVYAILFSGLDPSVSTAQLFPLCKAWTVCHLIFQCPKGNLLSVS